MKILYDYQIFELQKFGGISRYFFELFRNFDDYQLLNWVLPIKYSSNEYLRQLPHFINILTEKPIAPDYSKDFLAGKQFRGKKYLYSFKKKLFPEPVSEDIAQYNKQLSINALKKGDFDIFHPTFYDDYFLEYINNKPYVITVYDMISEIFPEFFLNVSYALKNKKLIQNATKIIAISQNTRKDLAEMFEINPDKIVVNYLANSLSTDKIDKSFHVELPQRYLLYIGNRETYKNFYFFLQTVALLLKRDTSLYIICTGPGFSKEELRFFEKLEVMDKIRHYYVDDSSLNFLYKNAVAFVFPSLYEGFGIPVLEAFSCGCPVVMSNSSSLPEIGGDAALYFEPKNSISILKALETIVQNHEVQKTLINKGYEQLKKFSWQKTAFETKNVYQNILK